MKLALSLMLLFGCVACVAEDPVEEATVAQAAQAAPVGLSLWWENGEVRLLLGGVKTVDLYEELPRYLQELDITAQVITPTDQGIQPLRAGGNDMASLDWRGVQLADEDWRPEGNQPTTYTRTRVYRGARWMERTSVFTLIPLDAHGLPTGIPILDIAGRDDTLAASDGGFVRRFVARQVVQGCRAINDCSNATSFLAQGLMQFRDSLHPERSQKISKRTTKLKLFWTEDPLRLREVAVRARRFAETPYRYGFTPQVQIVTPPANGQYYVAGESFDFRITYRDGAGNQLNPPGSLHSYAEFLGDQIDSGIRYYDGFRQVLTIYYALKHREGNNIWAFTGPTNKLKTSNHVVPLSDFFTLAFTQIPMATIAEDGYTSVFNLVPNPAYELDPFLSTQRPSDLVTVTVPADAEPGTYMLSFKSRRDWGGEAIVKAVTQEVRVGQTAPSTFVAKTGNCNGCHTGQASFDKVLHGISDRRACFGCHAPLGGEPDNRLDFRIHFIHSRSNRMPADPTNCTMCHVTPPTGPGRGFPGIDALP
jgi:hypothetical protein